MDCGLESVVVGLARVLITFAPFEWLGGDNDNDVIVAASSFPANPHSQI